MATKWYLTATCALFSATAFAQTVPTDVELRASYCIVVTQWFIKYQQTAIPLHSDVNAKAEAEADLNRENANLKKLQLYLIPRMRSLDAIALSAAQTSANDDLDRVKKAVDDCTPPCKNAASLTSCSQECIIRAIPDMPTLRRKWDACRDLSWLPI